MNICHVFFDWAFNNKTKYKLDEYLDCKTDGSIRRKKKINFNAEECYLVWYFPCEINNYRTKREFDVGTKT